MANGLAVPVIIDIQQQGNLTSILSDVKTSVAGIFGELQKASTATQSATDNSAQALANMVDGLRTGVDMLNKFKGLVGGISDGATSAFVSTESVLADLNVVLGRTGKMLFQEGTTAFEQLTKVEKARSKELKSEFDIIRGEMDRLAQTTEFTYVQIGSLFTTLKQQGLTTQQILSQTGGKSILSQTLALSSASRGAVSLNDAAEAMYLSATSLGGGFDTVASNADRFLRLINNAKVGFGDLKVAMEAMGGIGKTVFSTSTPAELLTVIGALKNAGRSAATAGNDIVGFGRSLFNLRAGYLAYRDKQRAIMKMGGRRDVMFNDPALEGVSYFLNRTSTGKASVRKQKTNKLFALEGLGLSEYDFEYSQQEIDQKIEALGASATQEQIAALQSKVGKFRSILDIYTSLNTKLAAASKTEKEFRAFIDSLNVELPDKSRLTIPPGKFGSMTEAQRLAMLYKGIGTIQSLQVFSAMRQLEENKGNLNDFAALIDAMESDVANAQQAILNTTWGATELLNSAYFALNQQLGEVTGNFNRLSIEIETSFVQALLGGLSGSEEFRKGLGDMLVVSKLLLGVLAGGGGLLVAMFGFSQLLTSVRSAFGGVSVFTAIGAQLSAVLPYLASFAIAVGVILLAISAMRRASEMLDNFLGTVDDLNAIDVSFFRDILPILFGKDANDGIGDLLSKVGDSWIEIAILFRSGYLYLRDIIGGITEGIALVYSIVLGAFKVIGWFAKMLIVVLVDLGLAIGVLSTSTTEWAQGYTGLTQLLSGAVGVLIGAFTLVKGWALLSAAATGIWTIVTVIASGVMTGLATVIGKTATNAIRAYVGSLFSMIWMTNATTIAGLGMMAGIGALAVGIIGTIWTVHALINAFKRLIAAESGFSFGVAIASILILGALLGVFIKMLVVGMVAMGGFGAATWFATAPLMTVVAVVGLIVLGLALLGYALYRVGKYFKWWGNSATEGATEATSALDDIKTKMGELPSIGNLMPQGMSMPSMPTMPNLSGATAMSGVDMTALNAFEGTAPLNTLPSAKAPITINITHTTNVDKLDSKTARMIGEQLAPVIVEHIRANA